LAAKPPSSDEAASRTMPVSSSLRRPKRSASRPNSRVNPAAGSA
jgi:hypothetical protein